MVSFDIFNIVLNFAPQFILGRFYFIQCNIYKEEIMHKNERNKDIASKSIKKLKVQLNTPPELSVEIVSAQKAVDYYVC